MLDDQRYSLSVLQNIPLQYIDEYTEVDFKGMLNKCIEFGAKQKGESFVREAKTDEVEIAKKLKEQIKRDSNGRRST